MELKNLIEGASKLGIKLNSRQLEQFQIYYKELVEWNKKCNLTSIIDYGEVQARHFLDSLSVTLALTKEELEKPGFNIVDIGTGAGFPGVPLKIILSGPGLVLIESVGKKTAFLQHIVAKLELNQRQPPEDPSADELKMKVVEAIQVLTQQTSGIFPKNPR